MKTMNVMRNAALCGLLFCLATGSNTVTANNAGKDNTALLNYFSACLTSPDKNHTFEKGKQFSLAKV